jgi:Helix-turn-helix domain
MADLPVLLSTRQAARVLGVTIRSAQRFAGSGELEPAFKLEGKRGAYLFRESDVLDLVKRRQRAA